MDQPVSQFNDLDVILQREVIAVLLYHGKLSFDHFEELSD